MPVLGVEMKLQDLLTITEKDFLEKLFQHTEDMSYDASYHEDDRNAKIESWKDCLGFFRKNLECLNSSLQL